MKCKVCDKEDVIYSGIDAFVRGVPTEQVCYSCAYVYAKVKGIVDEEIAKAVM